MAIKYSGQITNGSWSITDDHYCDESEIYLRMPIINCYCQMETGGNNYEAHSTGTVTGTGRTAFYIASYTEYNYCDFENQWNAYTVSAEGSTLAWSYNPWTGQAGKFPQLGAGSWDSFVGTMDTNIPVFLTQQEAEAYTRAQSYAEAMTYLPDALNYKEGEAKKIKEYYIYNTYSSASVDYGDVSFDDTIYQRYEKLKLYSDPAFYIDANDPFLCHLAYDDNDVIASVFSSSSIFDVETNPVWTDGHVEYTYPFYKLYEKEVETGDYTIGRTWRTNIPIFGSMADAVDFLNGLKPITDALNWRNIAGDYQDVISNDTGVTDEETEFGEVYVQGFFSQQYLCGRTALANISSAFFDIQGADPSIIGIWTKIKEGVEMYGQDPMQAVQGLMYFPVDLSTVFTNTQSQNYVYFGGYKLDLTANVEKVIYPNGYKTIGTITINKSFNDWRDYEPYTKLYVYLPYCGKYPLELARYYGKSTEVRYYIDTRTGGCLVCLISDGLLNDYFNGQMGVSMPITLTDKSAYANTQISTLLKGSGDMGDVVKAVGSGIGSHGSVPVELAFGALRAGINVAKTEFSLTQNNVTNYNKTTGGSTSMLNEYLPQYVTFEFEIQQTEDSPNENALQGEPSNASGTVGSFSGYLEVEEVNLLCGIATENEKKQIINMLRTGIII